MIQNIYDLICFSLYIFFLLRILWNMWVGYETNIEWLKAGDRKCQFFLLLPQIIWLNMAWFGLLLHRYTFFSSFFSKIQNWKKWIKMKTRVHWVIIILYVPSSWDYFSSVVRVCVCVCDIQCMVKLSWRQDKGKGVYDADAIFWYVKGKIFEWLCKRIAAYIIIT